MISGALLLSPEREYPSLTDFYKRRLNRLFLPIFFWTLVYLVLLYLKNRSLGLPTTADYFTISIVKGHPYYHMWYLYMVWGLYLFTPFLRKIVKSSTRHNQGFFLLMFPFFLGYYLAGYLISITDFYLSAPKFFLLLATLIGIIVLGERLFPGQKLASFSLGAYLIHPAVLAVIRKFDYFGFPMERYLYLSIPLLVVVVTLVSLAIAYTLSKLPLFHKVI